MKKSIVTNVVKFRKKVFTRRKGIVSFVVAITLLLTYLLTASLPVFAGGVPNDAKGESKTNTYVSAGVNSRLAMVAEDPNDPDETTSDYFGFCIANGKKFPEYDAETDTFSGKYTRNVIQHTEIGSNIRSNHNFGAVGYADNVLDQKISKLLYIYLADPTNIMRKSGWKMDDYNSYVDFWWVIQREIWRYTDGDKITEYLLEKMSPNARKAFPLVRAAVDSITVPHDEVEYRYYKPHYQFGAGYQGILTARLKTPIPAKPEKPAGELQTTVGVDNKKASPEAALTIEISDDSVKKTVVDTVKYKHLVAGQSYTLTGRLMKLVDGQEPQEVQTATSKFTAEKSEGETTVTFKDVSVDAGATYVVYEKAESDQEIDFKDGKSKHVVEHANKDDKAQTVVVKKAKPEKPAGELQTTVGVDNKKASPEAALTIEISDDSVKKTVVDTVKYKHLVAGQSYTLTGRLMKLVDGQEPQEVQTATSKFTAEKSEGETTVTFKDVSVDAGATYVVYEKAESDQEIDFKDGKSKHVVEHANKDDKAQTVVVKKAKPEKPAGELQTTVGVDNKKASPEAALTIEISDDSVKKTVVDTVKYKHLVAGQSYTLTGRLMKLVDGQEPQEVQTATSKFTAEKSEGETTVTFKDVSVDAGATYVVYEKAESDQEIDFKDGKSKHVVEHANKDDKAQTVVVKKAKPEKPAGELQTTVGVDNKKASPEAALTIEISDDSVKKTVVDTVKYKHLVAGQSYTLTGRLMKLVDGQEPQEVQTATSKFTAEKSEGETTVTFKDVSVDAGATYVVYEKAESDQEIDFKDGKSKHVVEHANKDDKAQTVVVKKAKPEKPAGELQTTVGVDNKKASPEAALTIEISDDSVKKTVVDTVKYKHLVAGQSYTLTGRLMKLVDGQEPQEVQTATSKFTAEKSEGETTVTFKDVSVDAGATYVVYEKAESDQEIDFKDGKSKHVVEHANKDDKAQTVVVKKAKPEKPAGELQTTVGVDNKKASPEAALTIEISDDSVKKTVVDTVKYKHLVAGQSYTLTGRLMKLVDGQEPQEVQTATSKFTAEKSEGETTVTFKDVSVDAGATYVVYEKAESDQEIDFKDGKSKHVVEHANKDDKAQTVVVKKAKPEKPAGELQTTVGVDNKKASPEAALTIEISDDSVKKTVVDTVKYKHLVAGQSYTLTGRLMKLVDGQEPQEVQTATSKFTAEKSEGETTVTFKDVSVDAGATYVVYEKAESDQEIDFKDGKSKHVVEHANKDDKAQTVVVKKAKPEKPAGELQTTVGVDNKKASPEAALTIEISDDSVKKTVVDTVKYKHLVAGQSYTLTGRLMKLVDGQEPQEVQTATSKFTAEKSEGETTVTFKDVSVDAGATYVVYEKAESDQEIDFKDGKSKHVVEHANKDDKAQTVVVKKAKPEKPAGELQTTVGVDNKKASPEAALTIEISDDSVKKTVVDTVKYKHLVAGQSYTLTGRLMKLVDGQEPQEVQTATSKFTAEKSEGETTVTFKDVSVDAGATYVVYEKAESDQEIDFKDGKSKHVVEHANKDDKAQTVVVSKTKPEPGAQEVRFSKVNVGGEEIAGAEIHIKQGDTVVASWVSEAGKTHTLKLKPGRYIFHEEVAPGGYLAVTDIHFSVDETGQVTVTDANGNTAVAEGNKLTVTDQTKPVTPPSPEEPSEPGAQEVRFSKVNVGGEEIAGAEIHIKQGDTVVASWVSEAGKTHTLKLKPGRYIFHEEVAPGGYLAVTDIHFSVDETGQVTVTDANGNTAVAEGNKLTVTDQTKPVTPPSPEEPSEPGAQEVRFSKVNVGGEEIAGAEIHIKQGDTVVASWVSEAGKTHTLKLKPGHYIFHEEVAPGGYLAVTDIHFSVDETGQVTITDANGNTAVAEGNKLTVTDQSADKDKQDQLPDTGEATGTYLSILGMITAVFAGLLYRSKKK